MSLCPNCAEHPVDNHPQTGCMLAALIQIIEERGGHSATELQVLHANTNVDALWDDIGPIIDRLEHGEYNVEDEQS